TLVALIGNAVPISRVGTLVGSASEFVMALSLLLTERRTQFVRAQLGSGEKTTVDTSLSVT
ncbi:MAG: hypothetical protein F6K65_24645, partial [Moorea sp. SIO3C2]|nr:hypothetical protein [Moorena sp. SIO3C2]